ncbi:MAG: TolC family protein, partial [Flavobacteriales bacterium]|nr:TolC family protein [Flavobacteriales bacterium]
MKNIFIALAIAATAAGNAGAQAGGYSLTQACEYAKQHAFAVQNARHDENVAGISTDKLIGIGLPQVNASVSYQNFIQLPTSIIPGEIFGAPGEDVRVQFGTSQNLTAGIGVSQLLFDGSWLVGLEASRAYADLKSKQVQLSETEQKEAVTNAYHLVLIAERNVALLEDSRVVMQKMLDETSALYAQGMVEEQSVDEFKLALSDLDNRIGYGKSQTEIAYDLLKLQMGYPQQDDIQLTDNLDIFLTGADAQLLTTAFVADNRMEMQVQQGALNMQQLNLKNQKAKLLPSVGAFYNLQTQALRNEFNFADGSEPWFPTQVWGIQMNVPIFTGRSNAKGIEEAKVEVQ